MCTESTCKECGEFFPDEEIVDGVCPDCEEALKEEELRTRGDNDEFMYENQDDYGYPIDPRRVNDYGYDFYDN